MIKAAILATLLVCSVSSVASACKAPLGRYSGGGSGIVVDSDASPMTISRVASVQITANYVSNGSGTGTETYHSQYFNSAYPFTFTARGTPNHTWSATTCQGKIVYLEGGVPSSTFYYSVVGGGNEILLNYTNGRSAFTITLKKV